MYTNEFSFNINNRNLSLIKENFINLKEEESSPINIKEYKISIEETRPIMISWLSFLCSKLNFSDQTLFRCISIFDQYISKIPQEQSNKLDKDYLSLIAIACLSLATKLEEINCNYVSFFTQKVLNLPNCAIFSVKDLTKMEMCILKELNYKTLYTTSYDFMLFYLDIFRYFFNPPFTFIQNIKNCTEVIMKQNIMSNIFLNMTQSDYAYACLNQAFMQIGTNNNIMNQIRNILMIFDMNKIIKKNKSLIMNNSGNDNDIIDNDDNLHHNLEVNLLSLPSF